jgi:hypothetical protein
MKRIVMLVAALALSGCKDDSPPRLVTVCDEHQTNVAWAYTDKGLKPAFYTVCVRSHVECRPAGKDYTGTRTGCDQ